MFVLEALYLRSDVHKKVGSFSRLFLKDSADQKEISEQTRWPTTVRRSFSRVQFLRPQSSSALDASLQLKADSKSQP